MNQRAVELSEEFDPLYAVVGFHPDDAKLYNEQEEAVLKELLQKEKNSCSWRNWIGLSLGCFKTFNTT